MDNNKTPEPQILNVTGIHSQESVHETPAQQPQLLPVNRVLLLELTRLEHQLRKRKTGNIKRKSNILRRINKLRVSLSMQQLTLKDFI